MVRFVTSKSNPLASGCRIIPDAPEGPIESRINDPTSFAAVPGGDIELHL